MDVTGLETALSRDNPPGPIAERRRLCVNSANGFGWSINWDNCELLKILGSKQLPPGVHQNTRVATSIGSVLILSLATLSKRNRPIRN